MTRSDLRGRRAEQEVVRLEAVVARRVARQERAAALDPPISEGYADALALGVANGRRRLEAARARAGHVVVGVDDNGVA